MTERFKLGKVRLNGKVYTKIKDIAKDYYIDAYVLSKRLRRGFTLEQAVDEDFRFKYGYSEMEKSVKYRGVTYKNLSALSSSKGVEYSKTKRFLEMGYSLEYALKLESMLAIEFDGIVYSSKKELAEKHDINYMLFLRRLERGWSIERALGLEKRNIEYKGKVYNTYKDLALDYNIRPNLLSSRLRDGMSIDEAVTFVGHKYKNFTVEGVLFRNVKEAADYLGVTKQLLYSELKTGKSLDDVVGARLRKEVKRGRKNKYKNIKFDGKTFDNLKQLAEYSGVSYSKIYKWVSEGISEYELKLKIYEDKTTNNLRNRKPFYVKGVKYSSLIEVSKHFDIPYKTLHFRINHGYSIEQAIDPDFRKKYAYKRNK